MSQDFNSFEEELLGELREHVAGRPARLRRRRAAIGGGATAVVLAAVLGVSTLVPTPAYAVGENAQGDVVVRIHALSDSAGLEAALAKHGIQAKVDYQSSKVVEIWPEDAKPAGPGGEVTFVPLPGEGTAMPVLPPGKVGVPEQGAVSSPGFSMDEYIKRCGVDDPLKHPAGPMVVMDGSDAVVTIPRASVPAGKVLSITTLGGDPNTPALAVSWSAPGGANCSMVSVTRPVK